MQRFPRKPELKDDGLLCHDSSSVDSQAELKLAKIPNLKFDNFNSFGKEPSKDYT